MLSLDQSRHCYPLSMDQETRLDIVVSPVLRRNNKIWFGIYLLALSYEVRHWSKCKFTRGSYSIDLVIWQVKHVYKQEKEREDVKSVKRGCLVGWKFQKEKECWSLWQQKGKWHLNWINVGWRDMQGRDVSWRKVCQAVAQKSFLRPGESSVQTNTMKGKLKAERTFKKILCMPWWAVRETWT